VGSPPFAGSCLRAWRCGFDVGSLAPATQAYSRVLTAHPLETKLATAAVLAVAGDALAQIREREPYNVRRAASFILFDACYRGAFQHATFPLITDTFRGDTIHAIFASLPQQVCAALECTAVNQFLIVPTIYYPLFFALTGAVQGLDLNMSMRRAQEKFLPLMLRNYIYWLPVQYCQFAFIAPEWQVPYICAAGLVWNVILSAVAGRAESPVPTAPDERGVLQTAPSIDAIEMQGVVTLTQQLGVGRAAERPLSDDGWLDPPAKETVKESNLL